MSSENQESSVGVEPAGKKTGAAPGFMSKAEQALNVPGADNTTTASSMVKCRLNLTGAAFGDSASLDVDVADGDELLDFGSGKDGVLSRQDAEILETRVMAKIEVAEGQTLANTEDLVLKNSFLMAFRLYLAMHSSENADDGSGAIEDGVTFSFGATTLSGALVKAAAQMSSFHRYLRCRADEVRDAIKFVLRRAGLVDAERKFPRACESARLIRVNAANRHVPDYPQYAFVGADYCSTVTPRVREILNASKAALLAAQSAPVARSAHRFAQTARNEASSSVVPDF